MTSTGTETAAISGGSARGPDELSSGDVVRVLAPDGSLAAEAPSLSDGEIVELYRAMVRARRFDERALALSRQGRIGLYVDARGEEAATVGSAFALREQDWIFPAIGEAGAALWRGMDHLIDHLFGNARDAARGRQLPDRLSSRAARIASASAPVGTQMTHAVGFAWAAKLRGDPLAVLVHFGEGAVASGDFHNGLNFAGVYRTPTIFFCRHAGWRDERPAEPVAHKGIAYAVPGVRCDGNDALAVIAVVRQALARAARGEGPTLVEALTSPLGDTDQDLDIRRLLDPCARLRLHLAERVGWNDADQRDLDDAVDGELAKLLESAESAPRPTLASLFEDVFAEPPWHLEEQRDELLRAPRAEEVPWAR